jgi:uncharacterized protein YggU (UPF0235/DUF167 family)
MSASLPSPWRVSSSGILLRVRLTPKAGADCVDGLIATPDGPAVKARVRAVAEDNAANETLVDLIALWLDLPRRAVSLAGGHRSRTKSIAIAGKPADIEARLADLVQAR